MTQSFNAFLQFDENTEWRVTHDAPTHAVARTMAGEECLPHIRLQLFDAERQTMVIGVNVEDDRLDALTLFQDFRRMLDSPRRNIRNVNQTIDSFFDLDECAE